VFPKRRQWKILGASDILGGSHSLGFKLDPLVSNLDRNRGKCQSDLRHNPRVCRHRL